MMLDYWNLSKITFDPHLKRHCDFYQQEHLFHINFETTEWPKSNGANFWAYNRVVFDVEGQIFGRWVLAIAHSRIRSLKIECSFLFNHTLLIFKQIYLSPVIQYMLDPAKSPTSAEYVLKIWTQTAHQHQG